MVLWRLYASFAIDRGIVDYFCRHSALVDYHTHYYELGTISHSALGHSCYLARPVFEYIISNSLS